MKTREMQRAVLGVRWAAGCPLAGCGSQRATQREGSEPLGSARWVARWASVQGREESADMLSEREGGEGGGSRAPPLPLAHSRAQRALSVTDTFLPIHR